MVTCRDCGDGGRVAALTIEASHLSNGRLTLRELDSVKFNDTTLDQLRCECRNAQRRLIARARTGCTKWKKSRT